VLSELVLRASTREADTNRPQSFGAAYEKPDGDGFIRLAFLSFAEHPPRQDHAYPCAAFVGSIWAGYQYAEEVWSKAPREFETGGAGIF